MGEILLIGYTVFVLAVVATKMPTTNRFHLIELTVKHIMIGMAAAGLVYAWQLLHGIEYGALLKGLTLLCAAFILSSSDRYLREHSRHPLEYPIVLSLTTFFLLLLIASTDLISTFFAVIGFSLNLYVLILFDAPEAAAREAGIKYYYLSTFSTGLILFGAFLLYATTGAVSFHSVAQALQVGVDHQLLVGAIAFLLIGFFFKLSAFPGHLWAPEVYEGSPDPVMGFFMLPVKIAVLALVIQLLAVALQPAVTIWQPLLAIATVGSLAWGCFGALYEKKTKRFLAYASINQMGFLLIGVTCGTFEGYRVTLFYLFLYALMSVGFLIIFFNARRPIRYLTDFRGLSSRYGWTFAIVLLSMAGIPPLAGFFGKYYLLVHALDQELYLLVITGLATSLISTYYYLRILKTSWFEREAPLLTCGTQHKTLLGVIEVGLWGLIAVLSPVFSSMLVAPVARRAIIPLAPTVALAAAVGVVLLPNPIHNLLCLVTAVLATVFIYLVIKAEFLAFVFLIVYVGAVAILFLFVIMLLNVEELTVVATPDRLALFLPILPLLLKLAHTLAVKFKTITASSSALFDQLTHYLAERYQDILVFTSLYDEHSLLFILISFILLTAMIGAIVLATSSTDQPRLSIEPTTLLLCVGVPLVIGLWRYFRSEGGGSGSTSTSTTQPIVEEPRSDTPPYQRVMGMNIGRF